MASDSFEPSGANYMVCLYCSHLVRAGHRDGYNMGCGIKQNEDGQYYRLEVKPDVTESKKDGIDVVDMYVGCDDFNSSGLPAHPSVIEQLIKQNSRAKLIPVDKNATEAGFDLTNKINEFLAEEQTFWDYKKIQ